MTGRPLSRLARRLIQKYPQPWRHRYEDEVLALFEESPPGLRDVAELTRGWVVEHMRAALAADDRPGRTLRLLGLMRPASALVFTLGAVSAGYLLRRSQPAPTAVVESAVWAYLTLALVYFPVLLIWRRRRRPAEPGLLMPAPPAWAAIAGLPALFTVVVLLEWSNWGDATPYDRAAEWITSFNRIFITGMTAGYLSGSLLPGRRLLQELMHLEAYEQHLAGARTWVAGCHEMIALGVPSPLADAEAQVEHWTRERDLARAKVEQLGYRARFTG